jgi:hypothetical protein
MSGLFGWLVAGGWCWFVLREEYCWLVTGGWFVLREKYCWLVADKPNEQAGGLSSFSRPTVVIKKGAGKKKELERRRACHYLSLGFPRALATISIG